LLKITSGENLALCFLEGNGMQIGYETLPEHSPVKED
jgi:hypothetical protein